MRFKESKREKKKLSKACFLNNIRKTTYKIKLCKQVHNQRKLKYYIQNRVVHNKNK